MFPNLPIQQMTEQRVLITKFRSLQPRTPIVVRHPVSIDTRPFGDVAPDAAASASFDALEKFLTDRRITPPSGNATNKNGSLVSLDAVQAAEDRN